MVSFEFLVLFIFIFLSIAPCLRTGTINDDNSDFNRFLLRSSKSSSKRNKSLNKVSDERINVLILGAAEFIGASLAHHLVQLQHPLLHDIIAVDDFSDPETVLAKRQRQWNLLYSGKHHARVIERDVCDESRLLPILSRYKITHVFFFYTAIDAIAERICFARIIDSFSKYHKSNIEKKQSGLTVFYNAQPYCPFSSTVMPQNTTMPMIRRANSFPAITAANAGGRVPCLSNSHQLAYKAITERAYQSTGIVATGFLFPTVYGPWMQADGDIYVVVDRILKNETIFLPSPEPPSTAYISINEVVEQLTDLLLADNQVLTPSIVPLHDHSDPQFKLSFRDLLLLISRLTNSPVRVRHVPRIATKNAISNDTEILRGNSFSYFNTSSGGNGTALVSGVQLYIDWYLKYRSLLMPCAAECYYNHLCHATGWDLAAHHSRHITSGCSAVMYTVATGDAVDRLHHAPVTGSWRQNCAIAFVSSTSVLASKGNSTETQISVIEGDVEQRYYVRHNWVLVLVGELSNASTSNITNSVFSGMGSNPRKYSRVPKITPKRFFASSVRYAVYMDSKLRVKIDPMKHIALMKMITVPGVNNNNSISSKNKKLGFLAVRLPYRTDVSDDVRAILSAHDNNRESITTSPRTLRQQGEAYHAFEKKYHIELVNLFDGAYLIHDLHSHAAHRFRCQWYEEYQYWADRDQIPGAYALAVSSLKVGFPITKKMNMIHIGEEVIHQQPQQQQIQHVYARLLDVSEHWRFNHKIAILDLFNYSGHSTVGRPPVRKIIDQR